MDKLQLISSVFKASGHEARLGLLEALRESGMTANDLSKLFGTSPSYVHRHLQILIEGDLIKKEGRIFTLSTSGRIFINSLGWIEVIIKYDDFWKRHDLSKVPESLIEQMVVLKGTKQITSAPRVIDKILKMIDGSEKRILACTDKLPGITFPAVARQLKKGVKLYSITGDLTPDSKNRYKDMNLPSSVEMRTAPLEDIYMGILVVDSKEAGIIFQDTRGTLDWNCAILGKGPDFISWAENNFWWIHNKGTDI